ncbi:MAG TPA: hypothetical protein VEJ19_03110 [Nitrososphaerales archaeon]|nr:hypothetical protein [Nitrososphaerales archaeon]
MMTDSWLLEELAEKIGEADERRQSAPRRLSDSRPSSATVLAEALDEALRVLGRDGTEVIDVTVVIRYGLSREDIARVPGEYMSAMKDLLDTGCEVLENLILEKVRKDTGIVAMSVEEAAFKLKRYFGEPSAPGWLNTRR